MPRRSRLFDEAMVRFQEEAKVEYRNSKKDLLILEAFLNEKTSPQDAKKAAEELGKTAGNKWSSGNKVIPQRWITTLLDNIGIFIQIGDYATTSAPESVGLAWYAVRLTLKAIEGNYELYNLFGTGLSSISEIMILIQHYDELYDKSDKPAQGVSDVLKHLFDTIIETYTAVLKFSFAVKMHLSGGFRDKIGHAIGGLLGFAQANFQGKLDAINDLKKKILDDSEAVFQKQALDSLGVTERAVQDIKSTVDRIMGFRQQLESWHNEQMDAWNRLRAGFKDDINDAMAKNRPKTPWELALDEFETIRVILFKLAHDSRRGFLDLATTRFPGTCDWVFQQPEYQAWEGGNGSLLCISGYAGAGKSTLISVIANRVMATRNDTKATTLLYTSCGDATSSNASSVCFTILFQLHVLARNMTEDTKDADSLETCNKALFDFLAAQGHVESTKTKQPAQVKDDAPSFVNAFMRLVQTLGVSTLLVLDAVDSLAQTGRTRLSKDLGDLLRRFQSRSVLSRNGKLASRVLVGSVEPFRADLSGTAPQAASANNSPVIELAHDLGSRHSSDLMRTIYGSLKTVPGLTEDDLELASLEILRRVEHDDYRFSYLDKAMKVMRQPLLGSIERQLERLPEGGDRARFDAELLRIGPDYARLLQTALTWSLLGKVWPRAEVVLDDFNSVYRRPTGASTKWEFLPPSSIEMDQLAFISGSFLRLRYSDDGSCRVAVPNKKNLAEYCFASPDGKEHDRHHEAGTICARCQSKVMQSASLSLSEKEGHLDLAITCLTHLNHELFQFRAKIARNSLEEIRLLDRAEQLGLQSGAELIQLAKSTEANARRNTSTATDEDRLQNLEKWDNSDDSMDELDKEMAQHRVPKAGRRQTRDFWPGTGRTATLNDMVREMPVDDDDKEGYHDQQDDPNDANDPSTRYEVQYWPYHLRQAEHRWTPEERSKSVKWATLFAQLDKLVDKSQYNETFQGWQRRYKMKLSGPFTLTDNIAEAAREPLHVAAYLGLTSWAEHLLKNGALVNDVSGNCNAIQAAASSRMGRRPEMLKLLLEAGADVNFETEIAPPAFHMWLLGDSTSQIVNLMVQHGANPAVVSKVSGTTALHHFARRGTEATALDMLMSHQGVDINAVTRDGYAPLHFLLSRPSVPQDLLEAFVTKYKADVNAELPDNSMRPLHLAARRGDWSSLKILLESEVLDVDDPDDDGNTALQVAAMRGDRRCVDLLLDKGADLEHRNNQGMMALHQAAWFGDPYCVDDLLSGDKGADPTKTDGRGRTALLYACMSKTGEAAEKILSAFHYKSRVRDTAICEINKPDVDNKTPLRQAALNGLEEVVGGLIEAAERRNHMSGLDIDKQDTKKGMSALHCAARNVYPDVVKALLEAGADITLKDAKGRTALTHALESWKSCHITEAEEELVSVLIDADPKAASIDPEVSAICATHGSTELLRKLRQYGADLTLRDRFGWTPIELARKFQQKDAEAYLTRAAWTDALPTRWVSGSSRVILSADGLSAAFSSPQRLCVSTDRPLPAGLDRYYFEVTLKQPSSSSSTSGNAASTPPPASVAIGFGTFGGAAFTFPGCEHRRWAKAAMSWGYHSTTGTMCKSPNRRLEPNTYQGYGPGDTVGYGVDLEQNTAWFTLNGKKLNFEFDGVQGRLYPLLGLHGAVEIATNLDGPFKWEDGNEMEQRDRM